MQTLPGLHHITAVASQPQATIDFYHHLLGQRLVKKTVNFDDPGTYHFYFGDEVGTPGTILTFFPWPHMRRGARGNGETTAVAYTIAPASLAYWRDRLAAHGVAAGGVQTRFGTAVLPFQDPDGLMVELVVDEKPPAIQHWADSPIPAAHGLRGFHSVTLWLDAAEPTADVFTGPLGYTLVGQEGSRHRYQGPSPGLGGIIDILHQPGQRQGSFGAGSVHHIAFRAVDDAAQLAYGQRLQQAGLRVTPVQDRQYFRSIYSREPGGVLLEIATNSPGFTLDEPVAELGTHLKLPPWLEPRRPEIERGLPAVTTVLQESVTR